MIAKESRPAKIRPVSELKTIEFKYRLVFCVYKYLMDFFNFKNLETEGFVVVKNFLDSADLTQLKINFELSYQQPRSNKNYNTIPSVALHNLDDKIKSLLSTVTQTTDISVNWITPKGVFFATNEVKFDWHQDHEPFWWAQDSYNHLNFWMPVIKPDPLSSGLSIIPFSRLLSADRELTTKYILKRGATRYKISDDSTTILDDNTGLKHRLNIDISSIAVEPKVDVGDLIILRGDVIHRTQDTDNLRVSLGIRCYNNESILLREKFVRGSRLKRTMIEQNQITYQFLIDQFIHQGKKSVPLSELLKYQGDLQ